jgi:hypothetical protein
MHLTKDMEHMEHKFVWYSVVYTPFINVYVYDG